MKDEEMFNISIIHFRNVMCSIKFTVDEKLNAFSNLLQDYFRLKITDSQELYFLSTKSEFERRLVYENKEIRGLTQEE